MATRALLGHLPNGRRPALFGVAALTHAGSDQGGHVGVLVDGVAHHELARQLGQRRAEGVGHVGAVPARREGLRPGGSSTAVIVPLPERPDPAALDCEPRASRWEPSGGTPVGPSWHTQLHPTRPDVDAERAADVIAALATDDVCDVLVEQRGWGFEEYETWPRDTMSTRPRRGRVRCRIQLRRTEDQTHDAARCHWHPLSGSARS